ncbi:serine/threonine-protein phosphatase 6 regulatory ankyrin repeat subunit C-like isoform X10 [Ostrea edulis]|uniref:serine/threonine-protein phosphatase 6 regulatory ankyrin repeat subunit C-like isoform X10 n=1 Tax=Ostrea edulis TaxID=37623 RepID=UPI0024AF18C6|nr:serine/threonine-protein phosphatase 6 regulatory ankyrin repeat subunit C-like isoform X10 [Ostrea edulis]
MSEIVKYCPTNLTEIIAASARLNCGEDRFGNDQYLCLPNVRKTGLVEYCHEGVIPLIPSGYCVDTTGGQLYSRICEQFLYGCPSQHFQTNKIYRYPACLNINTESRCYFADPSCPNTTSTFTTEDMMETSSTYSNFSNTTVNTLYTTTTSLEDVTDVGAVVGGVLAAVFVITVLLILVCVVLRRRKQRKNQPSDGRDAETPLFESTNETGNRTEKNSNSPTDSHEPDNNDSVHDEGRDAETPLLGRDAETPLLESTNETGNEIEERSNYPADSHEPDNKNSVPDEVKNQIKRRGIDFLLSMSTEHGEYHNGIAQLLNVPVEVLGMGKEEIETFVRNYKKGSTKVYCGRGMVVGCFGAGKTTLVKKLKGEDVSLPPESTRGLEVHTDIFTVNQNETVLAVNKDQKGRQRLQINLDTLRSGVVKPSSDTDRSNANAYDDEIPNTTISSAIDLETSGSGVVKPSSDADRSNSNAYDDEIPNTTISSAMHLETSGSGVVKPSTDAERSDPKTGDEIPSTTISPAVDLGTKESEVVKTSSDIHGNQRSDETGKHHVKDLAIYRSTETVANKKDKNQQIPGHEIGMILPNVIDKPVKTISLLDFAGQDAYYACHHIFLSPRSFYILVTDMSKKLTEKPTNALQRKDLMYSDWTHQDYINHWLGSIHTYSSKTAPVILVQSHSEKKEKDDARSENDIFHIDEEKQERKNKDEDNETQLKIQHADNVSIFESNNKTRNRRVENGNFPADSHEPDNNDSVHNEGNEGDTTSLQPLTDVQQDNDSGGYRPNVLHEACKNAKLEMCEHLIKTHPNLLHSVDNNGWNAALHTALGGNVKILQLLADNEVDVKHKDNYGWNILQMACLNANLEMSRYIVQTYPVLLHSVDNNGWNAALHAARGGNLKILQLLADNEVDVKHKDNYGRNILHAACVHANLEMSRYIIQTYPDLLHSVDKYGWNAALYAVKGGNVKILQLLADNEVDVKHKDNDGRNILHAACVHANLEMSRYIIQTYPDLLHSVNNNGRNAALHAALGGNVKILQLLADNEVDVKHKDNYGWNILQMACLNANLEMSRYIVQTYPVLLHSVDNNGWNAALHAARGGNVKILQLLADNEVDVKHKDNDGRNILHAACVHANLEMSRYIIQTYPDLLHSVDKYGCNAALYAVKGGNVKILQLLADNEVDVKHKDNDGRNILHAACVHANLEMSRYIIQTYPDLLHSVNNDGQNAAFFAALGGNVKILELLADHGVKIKTEN